MPVPKKGITSTPETPTLKSSSSTPDLPQQQEFHQHLRALARSAIRVVIEEVMREELDQVIGVGWGECSPKRKGYRNGSYTRDLLTSTGRLEDINVPRDREGQFHTQVFERYRRYEPHIAEGLTQMFVAGTSTHKVGEEVFFCSSSDARTLFSCFHGLFWRRLWHAWSASGDPVRVGTQVARVSRSYLLASCTPLHNFRYGIL